jgi:hypothetical protein
MFTLTLYTDGMHKSRQSVTQLVEYYRNHSPISVIYILIDPLARAISSACCLRTLILDSQALLLDSIVTKAAGQMCYIAATKIHNWGGADISLYF